MNTMKGVLCEGVIFTKLKVVKIIFVSNLVLLSFILNKAAQLNSGTNDGNYYVSQLLLSVIIINYFPILLGAIVGASDYNWNTLGDKSVVGGKFRVITSKVVFILLSCIVISLIYFFSGVIFSYIENIDLYRAVLQLLATIYSCFFWAMASFLLSIIFKNVMISSLICMIYEVGEVYCYQYVGNYIKCFLPIWNQRGFMVSLFSQKRGLFIIPSNNYNSSLESLAIYSGYLFFMIIFLFFITHKREIKE